MKNEDFVLIYLKYIKTGTKYMFDLWLNFLKTSLKSWLYIYFEYMWNMWLGHTSNLFDFICQFFKSRLFHDSKILSYIKIIIIKY